MTRTKKIEKLAEARGQFIHSLLKGSARPALSINSFRAAIPSFNLIDYYEIQSGTKHPSFNTCNTLASWNGPIALLVADCCGYCGNVAKDLAQTIYALDLGAQEYGCIISLITNNVDVNLYGKSTAFDSRIAENLDIDIIYDTENIFGNGKVDCTNGVLSIEDSRIVINKTGIPYNSKVDCFLHGKKLELVINQLNKHTQIRNSFFNMSSSNKLSPVSIDRNNVRQIIKNLTFGYWKLDELPQEKDANIIGYHLPLGRFSSITDLDEQPLLDKIDDVCHIWEIGFDDSGVVFDVCKIAAANSFESLGKATGVNHAIDAYFRGIPIEDILPELA